MQSLEEDLEAQPLLLYNSNLDDRNLKLSDLLRKHRRVNSSLLFFKAPKAKPQQLSKKQRAVTIGCLLTEIFGLPADGFLLYLLIALNLKYNDFIAKLDDHSCSGFKINRHYYCSSESDNRHPWASDECNRLLKEYCDSYARDDYLTGITIGLTFLTLLILVAISWQIYSRFKREPLSIKNANLEAEVTNELYDLIEEYKLDIHEDSNIIDIRNTLSTFAEEDKILVKACIQAKVYFHLFYQLNDPNCKKADSLPSLPLEVIEKIIDETICIALNKHPRKSSSKQEDKYIESDNNLDDISITGNQLHYRLTRDLSRRFFAKPVVVSRGDIDLSDLSLKGSNAIQLLK